MHLPPTAGATLIRKVQHMLHPLKMRGQSAAIALTWLCGRRCWRTGNGWIIRGWRRRVLAKHQRQLRGINPFGALSKAGTGAFSSQAATLGGSENATKLKSQKCFAAHLCGETHLK
jgi:hypothetical protein